MINRLEIAAKILAGFCANPSVFSPNPNCGWSLVNVTDADVAGYSLKLADDLIEGYHITEARNRQEADKAP
jgi:hypothetical protein